MSMIIIRMRQQKVEDLGKCIQEGLHYLGKGMSIYEEMKALCEDEELHERRASMRYPEYMNERGYPHMREDMEREDYPRYPEERRRYRRY